MVDGAAAAAADLLSLLLRAADGRDPRRRLDQRFDDETTAERSSFRN